MPPLLPCAPDFRAQEREEPILAPHHIGDTPHLRPQQGSALCFSRNQSALAAPEHRARLAAERKRVLSPAFPIPSLYSSPGAQRSPWGLHCFQEHQALEPQLCPEQVPAWPQCSHLTEPGQPGDSMRPHVGERKACSRCSMKSLIHSKNAEGVSTHHVPGSVAQALRPFLLSWS